MSSSRDLGACLDWLDIARVVKPHGLLGKMGVLPYSPDSQSLTQVDEVRLTLSDGSVEVVEVAEVRPMGKGFLLQLAGISSCDQAERFRGAQVAVARAALPALPAEQAYAADLVGARVLGPDGTVVGTVLSVIEYPSVDALVIDCGDGCRAELPLVEDWVERLDAEAGVVALRSVEGLVR